MRCSVVIPCHNGVALTRACLASLLAQQTPADEILLVDNASSDDTRALAQLAPSVRVLRQAANLGFAGGVNVGIRAARGDTVLVLNNDTQAAENLLHEMHCVLDSDAGIGAVAPLSNKVKGDARIHVGDIGRDPDLRRLVVARLANGARIQDADALTGLCLLMRRTTLDQVGLFDERFGLGNCEDDDLSLRLRLHGYRLAIAGHTFLHHECHATFRSLGVDMDEEFRLRYAQFEAKWRDHPAGAALLAVANGDLENAARHAERARIRVPQWPDADLYLGRYHERFGDPRRAERHLRTFLGHSPEHVEAWLTLALARVRAGDRDDGLDLLQNTLGRLRPSRRLEARTWQRLGQLDHDAGHHRDALASFEVAAAALPDCGEIHNWIGTCQLALGQLEAARAAFEQAIELGHALAHSNLGICLHHLGHPQEALRSFERAVALLPESEVARRNYKAGAAAFAALAAERGALPRASATNSATIVPSGVDGTQPIASRRRASDGSRRGGSTNPAGNTSPNGTCTISDALTAVSRTRRASSATDVSTALPTLTTRPGTVDENARSTSARATSPT
ncbi:MAG TPA: glycosyltransferase [bacterium]|nr:glycosyltransferase [bacterium]